MIPEIHPVLIVLVLPAIVGLVNMLKDLGLPSRWSGPVSVLLAVIGGVTFWLYGQHELFTIVLGCILLGLGASGFYDLSKLIGSNTQTEPRRATTRVVWSGVDPEHVPIDD